jgi:hypothetical protein
LVPAAQATGAFTISTKADGVSTSALNLMALRTEVAATTTSATSCLSTPYYATITEIVDSALWYDDVIALAIEGGDFALATTTGTKQLTVWAVPSTLGKGPFQAPLALLDFLSDTTAAATVGANTGLVTGVAAGTALITCTITGKADIGASATCTTP